jgi:ABC-type antimicrobial peptide transport system permease subunit
VIVGLLAGLAGARLINGLLFQTSAADPPSLSISIAALILVTLLAVTIPAIRAASINPVETLRSE